MEPLTENKLVLVIRQTRLDELVARFNTVDQARFYLEHLGADFSDYQREHDTYRRSVREVETVLRALARVHMVDRSFLPNFSFGPRDTIVTLGQDGLVANTVKYLDGQPLIGVNPEPERWDGMLLPFQAKQLGEVVRDVFAGRRPVKEVTMAEATLNNGQVIRAVNDLFIGPRSHTSARYQIQLGDRTERHSSSGLIVSTGLGSTGWLKSLVAGALAITCNVTRGGMEGTPETGFAWDANYLCFTVREPFPSKTSSASLITGRITEDQPLELVSQMADHGGIFSDGIENDFLAFNSGTRATITLAQKRGRLVV